MEILYKISAGGGAVERWSDSEPLIVEGDTLHAGKRRPEEQYGAEANLSGGEEVVVERLSPKPRKELRRIAGIRRVLFYYPAA